MALTFPNGGMFGIKLVGPDHTAFDFHRMGAEPTALMNFPDSPAGRKIASSVPIGHKSLVYLMAPRKRFASAIEYVKWDHGIEDVLREGTKVAMHHNAIEMLKACNYPRFAKIWRCVRVIAWIEIPENGPATDFNFHQGDIMFDMDEAEYFEMFDAVPWDWRLDTH